VINRAARLLACGVSIALVLAGGALAQAQGGPPHYVTLTTAHHIYVAPHTSSSTVASVPSLLGGEPTVLAVDQQTTSDSIAWMHVSYRSLAGWLPASDTAPVALPKLAAGSGARLSALLDRAGQSAGGEVATLQGLPLWSRRAGDAHPLASNAKLFTAAAALARFGNSIRSLLRRLLPPSDNVLAQSLSDRLGDGSAALGAQRAVSFARGLGVAVSLADGSGLSYSDRASADSVLRFLIAISTEPWFLTLHDALAVTGVNGTLEFRMRNTVASGRCSAKTGSLNYTSNLSGYCRTLAGHVLVFSLLMDHHSIYDSRSVQDQIVDELVKSD
jgi:D-Ala-D-Ala carboxypeptidase 3 (S13) family